ncbi:hypothetical protein ER308_04650 [Egibacter rhizosphaerae]|uniref:Uncharacterized protein n=1 Tax=Egibacter rhizosphaerae TaxID=1670831 RepID=A0A411YCG0_9ACTN|nr:hypothetical protein [Egibacter rhizosphaerae]QBI18904.1 hypothetical protein ER308_04650 [Egibacter rhizosphaerae]
MRRVLLAVLFVAVAACEPAESEDPLDGAENGAGDADESVPSTLSGLQEVAGPAAEEWNNDARLAELHADLGEDDVESARLTYVAPGATSLLHVDVSEAGVGSNTATLETIGLDPVPEEALTEVPDLDDAMDPAETAAAGEPALSECGHGAAEEVRYMSGAPEGWDGDTWRVDPQWRVMLLVGEGGVVFDDLADLDVPPTESSDVDVADCVDLPDG